MKAIRRENKIESFGKPAAQLTDAGGSPAGGSNIITNHTAPDALIALHVVDTIGRNTYKKRRAETGQMERRQPHGPRLEKAAQMKAPKLA